MSHGGQEVQSMCKHMPHCIFTNVIFFFLLFYSFILDQNLSYTSLLVEEDCTIFLA